MAIGSWKSTAPKPAGFYSHLDNVAPVSNSTPLVTSDMHAAIVTNRLPAVLQGNKSTCRYLLGGLIIGVMTSFALAIWWWQSQNDLLGGFTLGSYIVGVDALSVAVVGVFHVPSCCCWKAIEPGN